MRRPGLDSPLPGSPVDAGDRDFRRESQTKGKALQQPAVILTVEKLL